MPLQPSGNPIGKPFIELQSVDSTNKYAMQLIQQGQLPGGQPGDLHGTAVFGHEQTAGKGQRSKTWTSEKTANIILSIIINPYPVSLADQFNLAVCAGVSMWEFFSKYAGDETRIKWPNDLYWRDRKAGGVLIESIVGSSEPGVRKQESETGNWKWAVAGFGININQTNFPVGIPNPVSLKQITGKNFDPVELAKELCTVFEKKFQMLRKGNTDALFEEYLFHLYKKNETVKLKHGNRVFETTITGVSKTGQLITRHSIEERFDFGEVEWVI